MDRRVDSERFVFVTQKEIAEFLKGWRSALPSCARSSTSAGRDNRKRARELEEWLATKGRIGFGRRGERRDRLFTGPSATAALIGRTAKRWRARKTPSATRDLRPKGGQRLARDQWRIL